MIGIYKITSPSGRVYIGQSIDVEDRIKRYSNVKNSKNQRRLHFSLGRYGYSAHTFEVVEECKVEELNTRERYWQDFYSVLGQEGLNCMLIGTEDLRVVFSEESRSKGVSNTDYNLRTANTDYVGRTLNTDWVAKVSNTDYSLIAKKISKPILQFEKDGTFVREWLSGKEAGEALGFNKGDITGCCRGRYKAVRGFVWRYK